MRKLKMIKDVNFAAHVVAGVERALEGGFSKRFNDAHYNRRDGGYRIINWKYCWGPDGRGEKALKWLDMYDVDHNGLRIKVPAEFDMITHVWPIRDPRKINISRRIK